MKLPNECAPVIKIVWRHALHCCAEDPCGTPLPNEGSSSSNKQIKCHSCQVSHLQQSAALSSQTLFTQYATHSRFRYSHDTFLSQNDLWKYLEEDCNKKLKTKRKRLKTTVSEDVLYIPWRNARPCQAGVDVALWAPIALVVGRV